MHTTHPRPSWFSRALRASLPSIALCLTMSGGILIGADVVVDGTTATSVSAGSRGQSVVDLAPSDSSGISHNKYTTFNVSTLGVDLNNQSAGARTILNEVTSANPSLIEGKLEVLGPQAHVVLVNPNGITVNGGSFVNTGGIALSTGQVGFQSEGAAPFPVVNHIKLTNGQAGEGQITIGAAGLMGDFTFLDLISRKIQIDGPIINTNPDPKASVSLIAGKSIVTLNSSVSPGNNSVEWAKDESNGGSSPNQVLIDITRPASISTSRILIAVRDDGAGVRNAGNLLAGSGGFILRSNGNLELQGGAIVSKDALVLEKLESGGSDFTFNSNAGTTGISTLSAEAGLGVYAQALTLADTSVIAAGGKIELGIKGSSPTRELSITSASGLSEIQNVSGSIGLYAKGQNLTIEGTRVNAGTLIDIEGADLTLAGRESQDGWKNGEISGGQMTFNLTGQTRITGADVISATDLKLKTTSLTLDSALPGGKGNSRSQVTAVNGGLVVETTSGDILNKGSTLQGTLQISGDAESKGGVTLKSAGNILNYSYSAEQLGIIFSKTDDLSVTAAGNVENNSARMISNGAVDIQVTGQLANKVDYTASTIPPETYEMSRPFLFFFKKTTRVLRISGGNSRTPGQLAYIISGKGLSIHAGSLTNDGGEIDANGGNIVVDADSIVNRAQLVGDAYLETTKNPFGSSYKGRSDMQLLGGLINGSSDVTLNATSSLLNDGGRILSLGNLSVQSAEIQGNARTLHVLQRYGYSNPLMKQSQKLFQRDQGGEFVATGLTTLNSTTKPVVMSGGKIEGSLGVLTPGGLSWIRPNMDEQPEATSSIGMMERLFN